MYQAILCDLDGVLRLWAPEETAAIERAHGLAAGAIGAAAFESALLEQAVMGRIEDAVWRQRVAASLARGAPGGADAAAAWSRLTGSVNAELLAVLAEERARGMRIGLVSNATTRLEADLAALAIDRSFDVIASSARLGFGKPGRKIYEWAAQRAGCPASACVFIDDTAANVEGAALAGMTGIRYTTVAAVREALAMLLG